MESSMRMSYRRVLETRRIFCQTDYQGMGLDCKTSKRMIKRAIHAVEKGKDEEAIDLIVKAIDFFKPRLSSFDYYLFLLVATDYYHPAMTRQKDARDEKVWVETWQIMEERGLYKLAAFACLVLAEMKGIFVDTCLDAGKIEEADSHHKAMDLYVNRFLDIKKEYGWDAVCDRTDRLVRKTCFRLMSQKFNQGLLIKLEKHKQKNKV